MNSRLFAGIYESPVWRPLHTRLGSGLSLQDELNEVVGFCPLGPGETIVDLASGTGHYARAFAIRAPDARVYAVDISVSMLRRGADIAKRAGLGRIRFLRADASSLPFTNASVDRVNCGGALHLFPDLRDLWRELARILSPGGVFTAMTIVAARGPVGVLQRRLVKKGQATFFEPNALETELRGAGFYGFVHRTHGILLLFGARRAALSS